MDSIYSIYNPEDFFFARGLPFGTCDQLQTNPWHQVLEISERLPDNLYIGGKDLQPLQLPTPLHLAAEKVNRSNKWNL